MPVFGDFEEDKAILPLRIMPSDRGVPPPLPSRSTSLGPWGVGIHISEGSVHGDRAGAGAGGAGAETQNGVSTDPSPLGSPAEVSAEPWSAAKDLQSAARSLPAAGQQAVTSRERMGPQPGGESSLSTTPARPLLHRHKRPRLLPKLGQTSRYGFWPMPRRIRPTSCLTPSPSCSCYSTELH